MAVEEQYVLINLELRERGGLGTALLACASLELTRSSLDADLSTAKDSSSIGGIMGRASRVGIINWRNVNASENAPNPRRRING